MRDELYLEFVNSGISKLLEFQDLRKYSLTEGCFFYPYWRDKKASFVNARWQEAILSLSWYYNKYNSEEIWIRIVKGIDFWCKLQHKNGSFPEYTRLDRSFSATAFSTLAIVNSIILLNYSKENWIEKIKKSCEYLIKNDEFFLTSNEMAASLVLLKFGNYVNNIKYLKESERKLNVVLKNQSKAGYYKENNNFDLFSSSLTLELLGHYYLITNDKVILDSASRFVDFVLNLNLKFAKNIQVLVIDGFEVFSENTLNGKLALKKILNNFNVQHFKIDNDLCTNLYRLGYAYDNFKVDLEHRDLEEEIDINKSGYFSHKPSKFLNLLRPFGIHKFRRLKSFFI